MAKNAVITGTNRGIGRALLEAFAQDGYNVWACARTRTDEFEEDIGQIRKKTGRDIIPVYFDLSDEAQVREGMKTVLSEKKDIDVLVNNAGAAHGGLLTMTPVDTLRSVYEVNVFAQVLLMQAAARRMMRQGSGCIINMCSVGGIEANPGYLAYGSSKAALAFITRTASKELGRYGIRVNGIAPGLIDTDMGHYKTPEEQEKVLGRVCLGRIGRPDEVAKAALYLASEEAAYITGHILVLDGGRL
ncbi:MAG: SDR family oxidoreductase [Eubacterium sp.]|nr:SDR family oxidoreductase [Eubacterium sp.]